MKLISEHIRLLLHQNDCVVVPGLGGFILNRLPAVYDEKEKCFYPSRALPFFNKQLQSNDGLLAAALVKTQGLDYLEAKKTIVSFVNQVKETLEDKRPYVLQGLGEFQANHEGQITFFPDPKSNVSEETYGLDALSLKPLVKASRTQREALAPIRKKSKTWFTLVSCMLIIAFGGWWVSQSVKTPFGTQWSALNPFNEMWQTPKPALEQQTIVNDVAEGETGTETEGEIGTEGETETEREIETGTETVANTAVPSADSAYYIVVGAFKSEQNATRYETELKSKGFSACSYTGNDSPLVRVCAEKHTQRFEAEERLSLIQGEANPNAWILAVANDIP